jgi:hypothetical protein
MFGPVTSPRFLVLVFGILCAAIPAPVRSNAPSAADPAGRMAPHTLAYAGPEARTLPEPGVDPASLTRAEAALEGAAYFAAYAEGPGGQTGLWSGAHSVDIATRYALAACGAGCRVLATRQPVHQPEPGATWRPPLFLRPDLARRLGAEWPFVTGQAVLAIGGAGAWGTGHSSTKFKAARKALDQALQECEARRQAERTPPGVDSPRCKTMSLRDQDVTDLRPKTPLYPAPFTVGHASLQALGADGLQLVVQDGTFLSRLLPEPGRLYGTRAVNGEGAMGWINGAGWPEAGAAMALALCEAKRRLNAPPCTVAAVRQPRTAPAEGVLVVGPATMEAFTAWQAKPGAGAFAIGPFGGWGTSYGFADVESARQTAADWCAYHARRGNDPFTLRSAFIDPPPCRIVAERAP